MPCCTPTIIPFQEVATSTVGYTPSLSAIYGSKPKVVVWYRQEDGTYFQSTFGTQIVFDGSNININHGGVQTGFISVN